MTAFKRGQRIRIAEHDGTVQDAPVSRQWLNYVTDDGLVWTAPQSLCTLMRPPLRVGDVLTADDPEPPDGVVVYDADCMIAWLRNMPGEWRSTSGAVGIAWSKVTRCDLTVLYVPEGTP